MWGYAEVLRFATKNLIQTYLQLIKAACCMGIR